MYILLLKYCNIRYVFFILCGNKDYYYYYYYYNVLEYALFRSEMFFCLMLSGSFSPWSINIRCNDSDAKQ